MIEVMILNNLCPAKSACTEVFAIIAIATLIADIFVTFPLIMATVHELIELSIFKNPEDDLNVNSNTESSVFAV